MSDLKSQVTWRLRVVTLYRICLSVQIYNNNNINDENKKEKTWPYIRIFSHRNEQIFDKKLQAANWHGIYERNDVNEACNEFNDIIIMAFNESFIAKQLLEMRCRQ